MVKSDGGARIAILLAALGLAVGITGPKLYKMSQIRGWIPGGVVTREVLTQKGVAPARRAREDDTFWVSWAKYEVKDEDVQRGNGGLVRRFFPWTGDSQSNGSQFVRIPAAIWQTMQVGDPLEVIHVPGDESPHLRNDVFVESGQFVIDLLLLASEMTVAMVVLVQIISRYRRSRGAGNTVVPPAAE